MSDSDPVDAGEAQGAADSPAERALAYLSCLSSVTDVLTASLDLDEILERLVRLTIPALGDTCSIELLRGERLEVAAVADADPEVEGLARVYAAKMPFAENPLYPPRRVIASGRPLLATEVTPDVYREFVTDPEHLELMLAQPSGSAICVPLTVRGTTLGTITLARRAGKPPYDKEDLALAVDLAQRAALAISNAQLLAAADAEIEAHRQSEEAQRFLADLSRTVAEAADYDQALRLLADAMVPFLGDLCMVDVPDGAWIRRVGAAHADPACKDLVEELAEHYAPDVDGFHPAVRAIRNRELSRVEDVSDEHLRSLARDERHFEIKRQMGVSSYVCVPLVARGHVLGAMTIASCTPTRRYRDTDLSFVRKVATTAAFPIDNLRLLGERARVARALQSALLPSSVPSIPGIDLAARYLAAGEGLDVGGDFFDVFWAGYGSWAVVVGDVCGNGPEAAAVTGLVRHTTRAVAARHRDPVRILKDLHEVLVRDELASRRFCTLCCGVLRPQGAEARLTVACAGHPPPLVVRSRGGIEELGCRGSLLGVFENVTFTREAVSLAPGDTTVFYTDGVTEAGRGATKFGEERLRAVLDGSRGVDAATTAETLVAALMEFGGEQPRDDVALVVLRAT